MLPSLPPVEPPAAHPFLQRLARALLAKAERSIGQGPVRLPLDRKNAPELHVAADAEQLQLLVMLLDELCETGWVGLQIDAPRAFAGFTDRKPRLELRDFDALASWAGYTPQALRWQQQWLQHLRAQWAATPPAPGAILPGDPQGLLDYLARSPMTLLEGLSLDEATHSLSALIDLCRSGRSMALREASARVFQGRSKLLDNREELLRMTGAVPGQFHEPPIQLLLAPPGDCRFADVLFVENLVTFEHMADARAPAWSRSLLVYAAGFRGSARRLRSRSGCRPYLRAPSANAELPAIEAWLFDAAEVPVGFFGDLDFAGMQILASLREVFPHASAWQPGYPALARLLAQGSGHLPDHASKAQQSDPGETGCPYADHELLPAMRLHGRFVDQEAFDSFPARE
ncbi:Wadjet anti-phage system protein JetD domain-containing protein [Rhizobacter sp. P5_C2]